MMDWKARVVAVAQASHDPEKAHALEDQLMRDFIDWVASTGGSEQRAAAEIVKLTQGLRFERWCA